MLYVSGLLILLAFAAGVLFWIGLAIGVGTIMLMKSIPSILHK